MNEAIVKRLAEKYGTDEDSVQNEMKKAIQLAAENPTPLWLLLFGEGKIPDENEFCKAVSEMISA